MDAEQLAERMTKIGFPMDRGTIAKIESTTRTLEVSEFVALATALDVPPDSLFMDRDPAKVALAEGVTVDGETASKWVSGVAPLDEANARVYLLESPAFSPKVHLEPELEMRTRGVVTTPEGEVRP